MGHEHNIKYKNKLFSIVTLDLGDSVAIIKTTIFVEGNVLVSIEKSYKALVDNPLKDLLVEKIMKNQHADILKKLINSSYDGLISEVIINQNTETPIKERLKDYEEKKLEEKENKKLLKSEKTLDSLILNFFK